MNGIVQSLTAWLVEHTYAVVFLATLIDATAIPFPGRIVLAAAGALAASGGANVWLVIALGMAGVLITDHLWYFAGGLGGDRLLRFYCRMTFSTRGCMEKATDWLKRFGILVVLVGRFVAVVRVLAWPLAREHGVGYPTFLAIELPAAALWTALWVVAGWLFGEHWARASTQARWLSVGVIGAAALVLLVVRLVRRSRATKRTESGARAFPGSPEVPPARPRP